VKASFAKGVTFWLLQGLGGVRTLEGKELPHYPVDQFARETGTLLLTSK
jgi:hypothetical protein